MEREATLTGQIDLLLLAVLAGQPAHGYAVIERLRQRSGGAFDLPEGTVYPALYRLERVGLLTSEQSVVAGRTRRTYRVTRQGRGALRDAAEAWRRNVRSVEAVLGGAPQASHG